jgi:hypothetical protein
VPHDFKWRNLARQIEFPLKTCQAER